METMNDARFQQLVAGSCHCQACQLKGFAMHS